MAEEFRRERKEQEEALASDEKKKKANRKKSKKLSNAVSNVQLDQTATTRAESVATKLDSDRTS